MFNILTVSLPEARYILHADNLMLCVNVACFTVGFAIAMYFMCTLDNDNKKHRKHKLSVLICATLSLGFAFLTLILIFGCSLEEKAYAQSAIYYDEAKQITHRHKHVLITSKLGHKYGKLMSDTSYHTYAKKPQWWMYL